MLSRLVLRTLGSRTLRRGRPNCGLTGFVAYRRLKLLRNPLLTAPQESVGGLGRPLDQTRCRRPQHHCFLIRPQRQCFHHMYRRHTSSPTPSTRRPTPYNSIQFFSHLLLLSSARLFSAANSPNSLRAWGFAHDPARGAYSATPNPQLMERGWLCRKFGQLILRKIIKIVATRWQMLKLKYTKFNFSWDSAPDHVSKV